jgi:hypothetical protein
VFGPTARSLSLRNTRSARWAARVAVPRCDGTAPRPAQATDLGRHSIQGDDIISTKGAPGGRPRIPGPSKTPAGSRPPSMSTAGLGAGAPCPGQRPNGFCTGLHGLAYVAMRTEPATTAAADRPGSWLASRARRPVWWPRLNVLSPAAPGARGPDLPRCGTSGSSRAVPPSSTRHFNSQPADPLAAYFESDEGKRRDDERVGIPAGS